MSKTNEIERACKARFAQLGVTQTAVAESCGWTRQQLYGMLTNDNPTMKTLSRLALACAVPVTVLLSGVASVTAYDTPPDDWHAKLAAGEFGLDAGMPMNFEDARQLAGWQ